VIEKKNLPTRHLAVAHQHLKKKYGKVLMVH